MDIVERVSPACSALTPSRVAQAIKATQYKYFGDYEMSSDQREAVDILVAVAEKYYAPAGWRLVPVEPSDGMLCQGVEAMWPGAEAVYPDEHDGVEAAIRTTWSAMIDAALTPPLPLVGE